MLPKGFHRIRHYGLLANGNRTDAVAKARELLAMPQPAPQPELKGNENGEKPTHPRACPCRGSAMRIIEVFARACAPAWPRPASAVIRIDTS